ncbi:DHA2 family efflux MFS transporter permease subunit [Ktedonosporobacter rubrisoli]|uniref:DHA2 family efflux MFS transporter permease subunit n=1 Tax=Ktedonosporobacter rubrisoli TaxID=2509675 RepID=A0A4P6JI00_KTERU|nr:MFS transporter [Ktedonosporobacter rubrisoli]QBD74490.1 DHA2 family efflux MFS transporter permease subunit [Ktedonosporobacter rubrisoli]
MPNFLKTPCDEGVIRAAPAPLSGMPQCAPHRGPWVLVATIFGSSMAFIDGSVVTVALPVLQEELHASAADAQWIVAAYSLLLAALILVGGALGDRFGRKRIFMFGITIFTLASVLCGLAPHILILILARAIQGIGGALLVPGSLAILSASFPEERRGRAIGTWSGMTSITSAIGPVLGGGLVQYVSWRWIFFINVPLAVLVLLVTIWHVPESRNESVSGRLDWRGTFLVVLGLGAIVYALIEAGPLGIGHPLVLAMFMLGVVGLCGWVLVEKRSLAPLIPLTLFRSRTFSGANVLTMLLYMALTGIMYFLPFNLIQVQGYSATAAGAAMLPFTLIMFLLSRWAGGLVTRYGAKLPLVVGPLVTAISFVLFAVPAQGGSYWITFFPAIVVLGIGMVITVAPLTTTVMGAVRERDAGVASGINNAVSRTAGLLAVAIFGLVVFFVFSRSLEQHMAMLHIAPGMRQLIEMQRERLAGIQIPGQVDYATQKMLRQAISASFIDGFRICSAVCAVLALASSVCAWLTIEPKKS